MPWVLLNSGTTTQLLMSPPPKKNPLRGRGGETRQLYLCFDQWWETKESMHSESHHPDKIVNDWLDRKWKQQSKLKNHLCCYRQRTVLSLLHSRTIATVAIPTATRSPRVPKKVIGSKYTWLSPLVACSGMSIYFMPVKAMAETRKRSVFKTNPGLLSFLIIAGLRIRWQHRHRGRNYGAVQSGQWAPEPAVVAQGIEMNIRWGLGFVEIFIYLVAKHQ